MNRQGVASLLQDEDQDAQEIAESYLDVYEDREAACRAAYARKQQAVHADCWADALLWQSVEEILDDPN